MRATLLSLLAASLLCACATNEANTAPPKEEKSYVTGSNIPRRDTSGLGVETVSREALEARQRDAGGPSSRGGEVPRF
jgi:hypothetical protein